MHLVHLSQVAHSASSRSSAFSTVPSGRDIDLHVACIKRVQRLFTQAHRPCKWPTPLCGSKFSARSAISAEPCSTLVGKVKCCSSGCERCSATRQQDSAKIGTRATLNRSGSAQSSTQYKRVRTTNFPMHYYSSAESCSMLTSVAVQLTIHAYSRGPSLHQHITYSSLSIQLPSYICNHVTTPNSWPGPYRG